MKRIRIRNTAEKGISVYLSKIMSNVYSMYYYFIFVYRTRDRFKLAYEWMAAGSVGSETGVCNILVASC